MSTLHLPPLVCVSVPALRGSFLDELGSGSGSGGTAPPPEEEDGRRKASYRATTDSASASTTAMPPAESHVANIGLSRMPQLPEDTIPMGRTGRSTYQPGFPPPAPPTLPLFSSSSPPPPPPRGRRIESFTMPILE